MNKLFNYINWELYGREGKPPQVYKEKLIRHYAKKYKIRNFIETGTYLGETIHALRYFFDEIISIEKEPNLYLLAKNRFRNYKHVRIFRGDSAKFLEQYLGMDYLSAPTIFWLDAHYSGGKTAKGNNPLVKEVVAIINHSKEHVILIDDADFNAVYLKYIEKRVKRRYNFEIKNNIVRLTPK